MKSYQEEEKINKEVGEIKKNINMSNGSKWKKLRNIYEIQLKVKYSLDIALQFIYDFTSHLHFYKSNIKLEKTEYFEINNELNAISKLVLDFKKKLQALCIEFFFENNLIKHHEKLLNIYISLILFLTKYGSKNILDTMSYYILFYTCIQDIYFLISRFENKTFTQENNSLKKHKNKRKRNNPISHIPVKNKLLSETRELSSSLPSKLDNITSSLNTIDTENNSNSNIDLNLISDNYSEFTDDELGLSNDELFTLELENLSGHSNTKLDGNPIRRIEKELLSNDFSSDEEEQNTTFRQSSLKKMKNYKEKVDTINFDIINKLQKNKFNDIELQQSIYHLNDIYKKWVTKSYKKRKYANNLSHHINKMVLEKINGINTQYFNIISETIVPYYFQVYIEDRKGNTYNLSDLISKMINKPYINYDINKIRNEIFTSIITKDNIKKKANSVYFKNITSPLHISNLNSDKKLKYHSLHGLIKINFKKFNVIFIFDGYLPNLNISLIHQYTITSCKYNNIIQSIDNISNINPYFKNNIKKIIDLKQVLCYNIIDITDYCFSLWKLYQDIKDLSIIDFINKFLNNDKLKKADILISLLLNDYDEVARFKSHIIWDIIVDETNYNNLNLEEEMFYLLHPSLQIKLRQIVEFHNEKEQEITNIDENVLGYERKIMLSNACDDVKQKAFEKLKEINNKSNDNISKPQQFLDGLLKIPFGNYMTEWIIKKSNDVNQSNKDFIINMLITLLKYEKEYQTSYQIFKEIIITFNLERKIDSIEKVIKHILYSDNYDNEYEEINNIDLNEVLPNIKVSYLNKVYSILEKYIENADLIENIDCKYSYIEKVLNKCTKPVVAKILGIIKTKFKLNILSKDTKNKKEIIEILLQYFKTTENYEINGEMAAIENELFEENIIIKNEILTQLHSQELFYETGIPECVLQFKSKITEHIENIKNLKKEKQTFLENCYSRLDESIYGQKDAKDQIIRIISQWINGNQSGYCLGFEGSPGLGKTSLAKYGISKALEDNDGKFRPFGFIALGGSSNGSMLEGHSYTYVGSTWGRIVEVLMTSKCMNPIIFIDELDKISHTETGREIIGILTHLTDRTQNNEFCDKYFNGIKLDLSKVLFIFSYNDYSLLDSILADRIHRISFTNYTVSDKLIITNKYLTPKISDEINIMDRDVYLSDECIKYLITSYTYEAGVRKLKEKLYDIYRELNVRDINNKLGEYINNCITHLDDKNKDSFTEINNVTTLENEEFINVSTELIDDILSNHYKVDVTKPFKNNRIGVVYGLYATKSGIGGITIIQVCKKIIDTGNTLLCTGKQGDVMLESMKVALTLASNFVPKKYLIKYGLVPDDNINCHLDKDKDKDKDNDKDNEIKNKKNKNNTSIENNDNTNNKTKYSFHIHCPDGATPKDGPSAGCAISLGLISLLTEIPIRNDISMTGEIDILGNALPIGGLDSKIMGSKSAGINNVMIPRKNEKDLRLIKRNSPEILEDMNIIIVDTLEDVLRNGLEKEIN